MTPASLKRLLATGATVAVLLAAQVAPAGALAVFDGANYSQNLLTAVRTLKSINNQIRQLQNEALMLANMAKHLEPLDYSSAGQLHAALARINQLMSRARGVTFEVAQTEAAYARLYPQEYAAAVTGDDMVRDARERWQLSHEALRHSLLVQAQIVENVEADNATLDRLMAESQASVGSLQARQAGNQLIAFNAKQALQMQQLIAAQFRAEAMERARSVMAEEKARAEYTRFIGDGAAYDASRQ